MSLTNLLILINVLAYGWQVLAGGGNVVSGLFFGPHGYAGVLYGPAVIEGGQWWRIVSAAFLHGSLTHLGLNMLALYQVGNLVERLFGRLRFALLYAICVLGSGACVLIFTYGLPTLGASGAIFGLFGALVAVGWRLGARGRGLIGNVVPIVVINLVFTFAIPGISAAAHVGGLVTGLIAGLLLFMLPSPRREALYAYAYPAQADPQAIETIEHPPDAASHEEAGAPPLELRDPRE